MYLKKGQWKIFTFVFAMLLLFTKIFLKSQNYEFVIYIGVIIFFFALIFFTNNKVNLPNYVLWLLSIWATLHMAGGGLYINGTRWYDLILINIISAPYHILKYDQAIHIFGFFTATLAMYYLAKPLLRKNHKWVALSIIIVMAGLGLGALNEIIEFIATVISPSTGVGGYINTSLDLISNLIGAILAILFIKHKDKE